MTILHGRLPDREQSHDMRCEGLTTRRHKIYNKLRRLLAGVDIDAHQIIAPADADRSFSGVEVVENLEVEGARALAAGDDERVGRLDLGLAVKAECDLAYGLLRHRDRDRDIVALANGDMLRLDGGDAQERRDDGDPGLDGAAAAGGGDARGADAMDLHGDLRGPVLAVGENDFFRDGRDFGSFGGDRDDRFTDDRGGHVGNEVGVHARLEQLVGERGTIARRAVPEQIVEVSVILEDRNVCTEGMLAEGGGKSGGSHCVAVDLESHVGRDLAAALGEPDFGGRRHCGDVGVAGAKRHRGRRGGADSDRNDG